MEQFKYVRDLFIKAQWLAERGITYELLIDSVTDPYLHKAFVEFKKTLDSMLIDMELFVNSGEYLFNKIHEHLQEKNQK